MRLFIGINFNKNFINALNSCMVQVKQQKVRADFTAIKNLHLTIAFIGETNRVSDIKKIIESISFTPFEMSLAGCGNFRDLLWVGIEQNSSLEAVATELNNKLYSAGLITELRDFKPHITLARHVSDINKIKLSVPKATMTVGQITLLESKRINGKPVYTRV